MRVEFEIYSGRPNPGWDLTPEEASELAARLNSLSPAQGAGLPEPLGYRGVRITALGGGASVVIGAGMVLHTDGQGRASRLADTGRALECWLLQTAAGRLDEALRQIGIAAIGAACR